MPRYEVKLSVVMWPSRRLFKREIKINLTLRFAFSDSFYAVKILLM